MERYKYMQLPLDIIPKYILLINITSLKLHTTAKSIYRFKMECMVFHNLEEFHMKD